MGIRFRGPDMTSSVDSINEGLPVVTAAMKRWLSWVSGGGLILRSVGAVFTHPACKPDISHSMAEKLTESGVMRWQAKPMDRYRVKRDMLVLTSLGKDVLEGRVNPPTRSPSQPSSLGGKQLSCLRCLEEIGPWSPLGIMSGWVLDNDSGTLRVAESLAKRGLVDKRCEGLGKGQRVIERFYINDEGRKAPDSAKTSNHGVQNESL